MTLSQHAGEVDTRDIAGIVGFAKERWHEAMAVYDQDHSFEVNVIGCIVNLAL
jgi:hypothetical protein